MENSETPKPTFPTVEDLNQASPPRRPMLDADQPIIEEPSFSKNDPTSSPDNDTRIREADKKLLLKKIKKNQLALKRDLSVNQRENLVPVLSQKERYKQQVYSRFTPDHQADSLVSTSKLVATFQDPGSTQEQKNYLLKEINLLQQNHLMGGPMHSSVDKRIPQTGKNKGGKSTGNQALLPFLKGKTIGQGSDRALSHHSNLMKRSEARSVTRKTKNSSKVNAVASVQTLKANHQQLHASNMSMNNLEQLLGHRSQLKLMGQAVKSQPKYKEATQDAHAQPSFDNTSQDKRNVYGLGQVQSASRLPGLSSGTSQDLKHFQREVKTISIMSRDEENKHNPNDIELITIETKNPAIFNSIYLEQNPHFKASPNQEAFPPAPDGIDGILPPPPLITEPHSKFIPRLPLNSESAVKRQLKSHMIPEKQLSKQLKPILSTQMNSIDTAENRTIDLKHPPIADESIQHEKSAHFNDAAHQKIDSLFDSSKQDHKHYSLVRVDEDDDGQDPPGSQYLEYPSMQPPWNQTSISNMTYNFQQSASPFLGKGLVNDKSALFDSKRRLNKNMSPGQSTISYQQKALKALNEFSRLEESAAKQSQQDVLDVRVRHTSGSDMKPSTSYKKPLQSLKYDNATQKQLRSFNSEKLLALIVKQKDQLILQKKTISRLEKELTRHKAELKRTRDLQNEYIQPIQPQNAAKSATKQQPAATEMSLRDASTFYNDSAGSSFILPKSSSPIPYEKPESQEANKKDRFALEAKLVKMGLDPNSGVMTLRTFLGKIDIDILDLKRIQKQQAATIKRYRQLMTENLITQKDQLPKSRQSVSPPRSLGPRSPMQGLEPVDVAQAANMTGGLLGVTYQQQETQSVYSHQYTQQVTERSGYTAKQTEKFDREASFQQISNFLKVDDTVEAKKESSNESKKKTSQLRQISFQISSGSTQENKEKKSSLSKESTVKSDESKEKKTLKAPEQKRESQSNRRSYLAGRMKSMTIEQLSLSYPVQSSDSRKKTRFKQIQIDEEPSNSSKSFESPNTKMRFKTTMEKSPGKRQSKFLKKQLSQMSPNTLSVNITDNEDDKASKHSKTSKQTKNSRASQDSKTADPTILGQPTFKASPTFKSQAKGPKGILLKTPTMSVQGKKSDQSKHSARGTPQKHKKHQHIQHFDHNRMEKLMAIVRDIKKASSFSQVIAGVLQAVSGVVNCSNAVIVLFNRSVLEDTTKLIVQKNFVDGKYTDIVGVTDKDMANPAFTRYLDAQNQIYNQQFISFPIFNYDGELLATLQVQSKYIKSVRKGGDLKDRGAGVSGHNASAQVTYTGFPIVDTHVVNILTQAIMLKLDQMYSVQSKNEIQGEMLSAMELAGTICTQRSQAQLVKLIKQNLASYFGFEAIGVMMRDMKSDLMFTINEVSTKHSELEQETDPEEKQYLKEAHLMRPTEKITIPNNLGVSGEVFKSPQIWIGNNMNKEIKFSSDVDNQTDIKEVKNFMIGPVFSHKFDQINNHHPDVPKKPKKKGYKFVGDLEEKEQLDFKNIQRTKPIGILQLINKRGGGAISEYDRKKFEVIQDLVGLSIDNASEQHSIINIRLGLYDNLKELERLSTAYMENGQAITQVEIENISNVRREIGRMVKAVDLIRKQNYLSVNDYYNFA